MGTLVGTSEGAAFSYVLRHRWNFTDIAALAHSSNLSIPRVSEVEPGFTQWLSGNLGVSTARQGKGWTYTEAATDVDNLTAKLFLSRVGTSGSGKKFQPREIHWVDFNELEKTIYERAWLDYLDQIGERSPQDRAPDSAMVAALRSLQKATAIKSSYVAGLIIGAVRDGFQVVVPVNVKHTSALLSDHIIQRSGGQIMPAIINSCTEDKDAVRRTFQSGLSPVAITSVTDSISLHAGEKGGGVRVDGKFEDATDIERVMIFGDVLFGGKAPFQDEGRASHDGKDANAIHCVARGSGGPLAFARAFARITGTKALMLSAGIHRDNNDIASLRACAAELLSEGNPA